MGSEKGQANLSDGCSSSQPTEAVTQMLLQCAVEPVWNNWWITSKKLETAVSVSKRSVSIIDALGYSRLSSHCSTKLNWPHKTAGRGVFRSALPLWGSRWKLFVVDCHWGWTTDTKAVNGRPSSNFSSEDDVQGYPFSRESHGQCFFGTKKGWFW